MADLNYTVNVNTQQARANIERLNRSVDTMGSAFLKLKGLLAGLALGSIITSTLRWADGIKDVSDATGIATANILGFSQAVQESGGSAEGATNSLIKLNENIGRAQEGGKSAQEAFAKVGVSLLQLKTLSSQQILDRVVQGLNEVDGKARQAAIAAELFGKGLKGVAIDQVTGSYVRLTEANKANASAVNAASDAQAQLDKAFVQLQKVIVVVIKPLSDFLAQVDTTTVNINKLADRIQYAIKVIAVLATFIAVFRGITLVVRGFAIAARAIPAILDDIGGWLLNLSTRSSGASKVMNVLSDAMASVAIFLNNVATRFPKVTLAVAGFLDKWKLVAAAIGASIVGLKLFNDEAEKIKGPDFSKPLVFRGGAAEEMPANYFEEGRKLREEQARLQEQTNSEELRQRMEIVAAQREQLEEARKQAFQEMQSIINAEKQRDLAEDIALLNKTLSTEGYLQQLAAQNELIGLYGREYELKSELLNIETERDNAIAAIHERLRSMGDDISMNDIARAQQEIELARYVADERLRIFQERVAKEQAIEQDAVKGIEAAIAEITESLTPFNIAQQQTRTLFDGMQRGIEEFATTGKFKFKDFALSIIRDILMISLKAQMLKIVTSAMGLFGFKIPGLASGGPAKAGQPYIVGENGPELFVPNSSGKVVPNDALGGGAGMGGPVYNTYNNYSISAIDSQSVAQFFAANRKMALGAVEMAKRELPYGVSG